MLALARCFVGRVSRGDEPQDASAKADDLKFVELFNGRDLTGWLDVNTSPDTAMRAINIHFFHRMAAMHNPATIKPTRELPMASMGMTPNMNAISYPPSFGPALRPRNTAGNKNATTTESRQKHIGKRTMRVSVSEVNLVMGVLGSSTVLNSPPGV
jgi:hypothetical protein